MMSMANLSSDGEFRYIVQWFTEFSELQRDDFVPVLIEYLLEPAVYMNGVANNVSHTNINAKPMSLFQCRIKLFRQWCPKWPQEFKNKLKEKIIEMDAKVGEKIINKMKDDNGIQTNGIIVENGTATLTDEDEALNTVENFIPDSRFVAQLLNATNDVANNEEGDNENAVDTVISTNDTHTEPEAASPQLDTTVADVDDVVVVVSEQSIAAHENNVEAPTNA